MELVEISPFLLVLSEKDYKGSYTEVSLENYEETISFSLENSLVKSNLLGILDDFPHKNYSPVSYLLKHPIFKNEDPCEIIFILLDLPFLQPTCNKHGLCFIFQNKQKIAKLSDIIEDNPYTMLGEVMKVAFDTKKGKVGEDLIVNLTNGFEKMFKNTSENYLKTICDKNKENKKVKNKIEAKVSVFCPLKDISNSGN